MSKTNTKKITKAIVSIVILVILGFGIFFIVKNKDALFGKVANGTTLYTQEQLDQEKDKAYNEGFNNAHLNNAELKKQVEEYLKTITEKNNTIAEKEEKINQDNQTIEANKTTIAGLNADIVAKQEVINEKQAIIEQNNATISSLQNELAETEQENNEAKAELEAQITTLQNANANLENELAGLTSDKTDLQTQINTLQLQNEQLQQNNATNIATITELNADITTLQTQVTNLTNQIAQNENLVAEYEANKEAWQSSIAYYEQFIASLETETQAVAIFEVNSAVYKAQIVTKGTSASDVTTPANTETHAFVGWYVDDVLVENINTYPITTNTKFVAKFDIAYNVKFMLDSESEFTTVKVANNNCPTTLSTLPTKEGYAFDGFTINGVDIIDYTTYPITQNTTFIAKFTKLHTVTFMVKNEVVATQKVRNGEVAQEPELEKDWLLNGEVITLSEYPIYADLTLVANTVFTELKDVTFEGLPTDATSVCVWNYKDNVYYSQGTNHYILNKETKTWTKKNWSTSFSGNTVWNDGNNYYVSSNSQQLIYNANLDKWENITWNGFTNLSYRDSIWKDGDKVYYSFYNAYVNYQYVLNKETKTWEEKAWNTKIDGRNIWSDGNNIYYITSDYHYVLDKNTDTWVETEWSFKPSGGFQAEYVWSDGNNFYYDYYFKYGGYTFDAHYILNKKTGEWEEKTWNVNNLQAFYIWTDGENYYYKFDKIFS